MINILEQHACMKHVYVHILIARRYDYLQARAASEQEMHDR